MSLKIGPSLAFVLLILCLQTLTAIYSAPTPITANEDTKQNLEDLGTYIGIIEVNDGDTYFFSAKIEENKVQFIITNSLSGPIRLNSDFQASINGETKTFSPKDIGSFSVQFGDKVCNKECPDAYINWISKKGIIENIDDSSLKKIGTIIAKTGKTDAIVKVGENLIKQGQNERCDSFLQGVKKELSNSEMTKIIENIGKEMIYNGEGDSYLKFLVDHDDKSLIKDISEKPWFKEYLSESIKNTYITGEPGEGLKNFMKKCNSDTCNIDETTITIFNNNIVGNKNNNIINYVSDKCEDDRTSKECKSARKEMNKYLQEEDIETAVYYYFKNSNEPLTDKNLDKISKSLFSECKKGEDWCEIKESLESITGLNNIITKESVIEAGVSYEAEQKLKETCSNKIKESCLKEVNKYLDNEDILNELCQNAENIKNCKNSLKKTVNKAKEMSKYVDTSDKNKYYMVASTYESVKEEKELLSSGVQAFCDLNLFECESRWSFYRNNSKLQMIFGTPIANLICYSQIKGYASFGNERKEISNGDGTTGYLQNCNEYGCDVEVEYDLRAQMTPPAPDNSSYLTYSYFYRYYGTIEKKDAEGNFQGYEFKDGKYTLVLSFLTRDGTKKAVALFGLQPLKKGGLQEAYTIKEKSNTATSSNMFIPKVEGDVVSDSKTVRVNLGVKSEDIDQRSFTITLVVFDASDGEITKSNAASKVIQKFSAPVVLVDYNSPLTALSTEPSSSSGSSTAPTNAEETELSTQDIADAVFP